MPDLSFADSIPENYDRLIFPLNIKPFAHEMAIRVAKLQPNHVLETAAGTGACSELITSALPGNTHYIVSDISESMLSIARQKLGRRKNITFEPVDAVQLPYTDQQFDVVVSMFGLMFFPDKVTALAEAHRVLQDDGSLLLSVWDIIERNPLGQEFYHCLSQCFGTQPLEFQEIPHNCSSLDLLKSVCESAGFSDISIHVVKRELDPIPALDACKGFIYGTPLFNEFTERGMDTEDVVKKVSTDLTRSFGEPLTGFYRQALFVEARK
ncbi:class I SAM-dependent methyltransferase [Endozoicomonas sp.]|uniref:class I SAM-dependent methyltransferase n=1 Tax=Endozoicomonas sp. TaxID=1892382 RepID=UPI00383A0C19